MAERGGNEEVTNLNSFRSHRGKGEYQSVRISETVVVKLCLQAAGFIDTKLARVLLMGTPSWSVLPCHPLLSYIHFTATSRFMLTCKIFGSCLSHVLLP